MYLMVFQIFHTTISLPVIVTQFFSLRKDLYLMLVIELYQEYIDQLLAVRFLCML
jgi:hypothetical protein